MELTFETSHQTVLVFFSSYSVVTGMVLLNVVMFCCSALQSVAVSGIVLQCVEGRCSALRCVAVRCSALRCVAVRCSVLQCVAVR